MAAYPVVLGRRLSAKTCLSLIRRHLPQKPSLRFDCETERTFTWIRPHGPSAKRKIGIIGLASSRSKIKLRLMSALAAQPPLAHVSRVSVFEAVMQGRRRQVHGASQLFRSISTRHCTLVTASITLSSPRFSSQDVCVAPAHSEFRKCLKVLIPLM